jgi:hypothetical protein
LLTCFVAELVGSSSCSRSSAVSTSWCRPVRADPNRAGADADSSDHYSGGQHLGESSAQHRLGPALFASGPYIAQLWLLIIALVTRALHPENR